MPMRSLLLLYSVTMLLLLFIHSFMATLAMGSVRNITTDQSALLAFQAHVIDPKGVLASNWSASYAVCSWVGITCGTRHRRITRLHLSSMALGGTIPPQLGNLSFLVYLNISHNNFQGHVPDELGKLCRLRFLHLNFNNLSGSLPSWIGGLSKLQGSALYNNRFTGPIPDSLFNLSMLEALDWTFNFIDGHIPSKIGNLSKLTYLSLGGNRLKGEIPSEISNLRNLDSLDLAENQLSGPIPPAIFNISTLTLLALAGNQLTGHLPPTLGFSLPNIEYLYFSENELSGTIPDSLTNASKLIDLELTTNAFSGPIPNTFGNLRFFKWLTVAENLLTTESGTSNQCSFLTSLTNCRSLQHLDVGSNPLGCVLPPSIGNFSSSLEFLGVVDCQLKGHIPQGIVNLSGLTYLNIGLNQLVGTIPTRIGRLWQLEGLSFHNNNLQGSIPYNICRLQRLDGLYLYGNQLSGNLPACLARLTSLRHLQLNSNRLNSSIPSSFWTLEYILSVDLSSNSFSGYLPLSIQNLKVLINLNLSSNQLSGKIPSTVGALKDLTALSLAANRFEGPIPESFGSLTSLESLDLSDNHLSGEIPKSLVALSYLRQLNVSHNKLEGEVPSGGAFKSFSAGAFSWNHALCGPPRFQVPPCKRSKNVARRILKYILPPVLSTVLVAVMVFIYCIRRQNMSRKGKVHEDLVSQATWRRISYLEIQRATEGFSGCNLLGTGSFGSVYRGTLSDGMNVAIKIFSQQSERAFRSFESECEILRNVRHRNLIKILSSCSNPDFKALVLEFMPNGSLEKWLHSHNYFLDILQRLSIMIDVGLAVEYLHRGHSSTPVVHCDLKPSNILLDEDMVAHVTDFGISKLLWEGDDTATQTLTMATIGYMAPEYGSEGIVSARCDVYSFGILLMETFTRKKPTDDMFTEEMSFRNWVKNSLPHGLVHAVDANLVEEEQSFSAKMDCILRIMHLALDCCREAPNQRIDMTEAVAQLKKIKEKFVIDVGSN